LKIHQYNAETLKGVKTNKGQEYKNWYISPKEDRKDSKVCCHAMGWDPEGIVEHIKKLLIGFGGYFRI